MPSATIAAARCQRLESTNPTEAAAIYAVGKESTHPAALLGTGGCGSRPARRRSARAAGERVLPGGDDGTEADRIRAPRASLGQSSGDIDELASAPPRNRRMPRPGSIMAGHRVGRRYPERSGAVAPPRNSNAACGGRSRNRWCKLASSASGRTVRPRSSATSCGA